jgi:hypothetical protein
MQITKEEANQKILEIMNQDDLLSSEKIHLFKELMVQCNLTIKDKRSYTPLMFALQYNQTQNLHLTTEDFNYLIKNSDLKQQDRDKDGWTAIMFALVYHQEENLNLSIQQFQTMYKPLTEEQQQSIFQYLIIKNYKNNNQNIEEINLLLYDLRFQIDKYMRDWLLENDYQEILQRIEKRDVFFQLHQEVQGIDKKEKMNIKKV